ncbi:hypothetical protein ACWD6P_21415 [Streptomyces sp. NPDC002446]
MTRKGTGISRTPALRAWRLALAALAAILAFLLGGASTAASASALATQSAGTKSSVKPAGDTNEEKTKRENDRGKARGSAYTTLGAPRHGGRPLPYGNVDRLRHGSECDPAPAHSSTKAAPRPERLPVLHCVFRC